MIPLLLDDVAVEERLWALPHRPGGGEVAGVIHAGGGPSLSETVQRGGFRQERGWAVSMWTWLVGDGYDAGIIVHLTNEMEIGGGSSTRGSQFQGTLAMALLGGYRFPVGRYHGPFVRGGIDLRFSGNDMIYHSLLELPRADVGWQFLKGRKTQAEIAATAGLGMTGRHDLGNGERKLDVSFANGATASFLIGPVRFLGGWTHVTPQGVGGGVDWVDAAMCGTAKSLVLCARAAWLWGDVLDRSNAISFAFATQVGFVLAFKQKTP
jgi:hypothetical protein